MLATWSKSYAPINVKPHLHQVGRGGGFAAAWVRTASSYQSPITLNLYLWELLTTWLALVTMLQIPLPWRQFQATNPYKSPPHDIDTEVYYCYWM